MRFVNLLLVGFASVAWLCLPIMFGRGPGLTEPGAWPDFGEIFRQAVMLILVLGLLGFAVGAGLRRDHAACWLALLGGQFLGSIAYSALAFRSDSHVLTAERPITVSIAFTMIVAIAVAWALPTSIGYGIGYLARPRDEAAKRRSGVGD